MYGHGLAGGHTVAHPRGRRGRLAPETVPRVGLFPDLPGVTLVILHSEPTPLRDLGFVVEINDWNCDFLGYEFSTTITESST